MVCLGNICRSPLAEGIMRAKVENLKLNITVDSAGTIDSHKGERPDRRSIEVAKKNNVEISHLVAKKFCITDFKESNYIFVMDIKNYNDVVYLASDNADLKKIILLTEFLFPKKKVEVPDPYYGDEKDFEAVYKLIDDSCEKIIEKLLL